MRDSQKILIIIILFTAIILPAKLILAHGGGPIQIENVPVGILEVSAWMNPGMPKSNDIVHITVGIQDNIGNPVLDSRVSVAILDKQEVVWAGVATTDQSVNRLFYETDVDPLLPGEYVVQFQIAHEQGTNTLSFPMIVIESSLLSQLFPIIIGVSFIMAGLLIWQRFRQYRQSDKRPHAPRRRHSDK